MNFCEYKNILGEPNTGIHSYRILNIAIFDFIITLLICIIISYLCNFSILLTCIIVFGLGIIIHRLFCVRSTIDKLLFSL